MEIQIQTISVIVLEVNQVEITFIRSLFTPTFLKIETESSSKTFTIS